MAAPRSFWSPGYSQTDLAGVAATRDRFSGLVVEAPCSRLGLFGDLRRVTLSGLIRRLVRCGRVSGAYGRLRSHDALPGRCRVHRLSGSHRGMAFRPPGRGLRNRRSHLTIRSSRPRIVLSLELFDAGTLPAISRRRSGAA